MARIAEDNDFDHLKSLVDDANGWILELDKADTKVWTRPIDGCSFQMVKIQTVFPEITSETLYDVLHDPDYRKVWDSNMLESLDIGLLNVNNDVGYYASEYFRHRFGSKASPPTHRTNLINVISFRLAFSVMSTPAKAERFCAAEKLVGYGSERRTNATQSVDTAQRFSAKERLREVMLNCSLMGQKSFNLIGETFSGPLRILQDSCYGREHLRTVVFLTTLHNVIRRESFHPGWSTKSLTLSGLAW